ncbi:hypothetical protein IX51_00670 [uncultured archaeon]|nr:hypothetical protein IX51_00670 [uncultured archaeon]
MNEKEFIFLIKDHFENAKERFGLISVTDENLDEGTDEEEKLMSLYKAWLILILNMIEIITDDNVEVDSASYLSYYALQRDEKPPFGPADLTVHEILGLFNREEIGSIFGEEFLAKYLKLDFAVTGCD